MGTPSSYSITTVCRLTGLSSRTLRHWERLGLLTPVQVDRRGFRHYGADNLSVVLHLMLLRTLGLPLPDRATWREVPPGWELLDNVAAMVEERARLTSELNHRLRGFEGALDAVGLLGLIQLLVRWRQP